MNKLEKIEMNELDKEVKMIILQYFKEENNMKSFYSLCSEQKLYFDDEHFKELVKKNEIQEAIDMIENFLKFVVLRIIFK